MSHPKPKSRAEFREDMLDRMRDAVIRAANADRRKPRLSRSDFVPALNAVLDEVLAMATTRLENDWTGGEVLLTLRRWRGGR